MLSGIPPLTISQLLSINLSPSKKCVNLATCMTFQNVFLLQPSWRPDMEIGQICSFFAKESRASWWPEQGIEKITIPVLELVFSLIFLSSPALGFTESSDVRDQSSAFILGLLQYTCRHLHRNDLSVFRFHVPMPLASSGPERPASRGRGKAWMCASLHAATQLRVTCAGTCSASSQGARPSDATDGRGRGQGTRPSHVSWVLKGQEED